jgi:hypothetical protein
MPNAMDLGPKVIDAFQGEQNRCGNSLNAHPAGGRGGIDGTTTFDTDQQQIITRILAGSTMALFL